MILAVLGDIHGNIAALKKAHKAVLKHNADKIYHLGDLGGYAPFVNEVVDYLLEHNIEGVQGNYDYNVARNSAHCGCRYEDPVQAELSTISFNWTKEHSTEKSKKFMGSLPADLLFEAEGRKVQIFHATPHKNNLYWTEDRPDRFFNEMGGKSGADILIYGHTHMPYRKDIDGRVFINAGSVGKPKDGDPRTCAAIIDIRHNGVLHKFIRVEYPLEETAEAIRQSGLPGLFAENLINAV